MSSVPWPEGESYDGMSLSGKPTDIQGLGCWPGKGKGGPRRLLMYADAGTGESPTHLKLEPGKPFGGELPTAAEHCFAYSADPFYVWESNYLKIEHGGKRIGLALGMRRKGKVTWWEATRMIENRVTPFCREVSMGGAIGWEYNDRTSFDGFRNPYLHKHNWLNGHLLVRMFGNGVIEVFARHVNARYVDPGGDCDEGVPVVGFFTEETAGNPKEGLYDGSEVDFSIGGVALNLDDVAPMSSPEQPGNWAHEPGVVILQPYEGFEIFGGAPTNERYNTPYICRSSEHKILKGMARSLHFSLSLSDQPARIARYLAPDWWYGLNCELAHKPLLPTHRKGEEHLAHASDWWRSNMVQRGFEVGNLPRFAGEKSVFAESGRREPSWEGELPYALLMTAYQTGDADDYKAALQSCYYFNDVIIEHADKQARMHGYPPPALSVPMNRVLANIGAWLETGDPFPRHTAEAVMETAYRNHLNSWPRLSVGRDAAFGRGAMMLYRYLNNEHFREIAKEVAYAMHHSQRPDGSFGDQGGGSGIHGWGGYITKVWMCSLGTAVLMDYLEFFPDEKPLWDTAKKYADWLVSERRPAPQGGRGWSYQHMYNGTRIHVTKESTIPSILNVSGTWHQQSMGRLFAMVAEHFKEPLFLETYLESNANKKGDFTKGGMDHGVSASSQYMPWVDSYFVQSEWKPESQELVVRPLVLDPWTDDEATVHTPAGAVRIAREGKAFKVVEAPKEVAVKLEPRSPNKGS